MSLPKLERARAYLWLAVIHNQPERAARWRARIRELLADAKKKVPAKDPRWQTRQRRASPRRSHSVPRAFETGNRRID